LPAVARARRPQRPLERKHRARSQPKSDALLELGRSILLEEAGAVKAAASRMNGDFLRAVRAIANAEGRLVVTGMGKANFVAQKISATFASIGIPSIFLHPADALHGDLGRLTSDDLVLALSHSGETDEMVRLIEPVKRMGAVLVAMVGSKGSTLGKRADLAIEIGVHEEAGNGFAPTTSTTVMLAMGDALAMAAIELRGFSADDFQRLHPAGAIGRKLLRVSDLMRKGEALPLVKKGAPLSEAIAVMTKTPGRPGAAVVVGAKRTIAGIFTDGDLRRLAEQGALELSRPVGEVMCSRPKTVRPDLHVVDAARLLTQHSIDQVPVVDDRDRVVGLLDVQELLAHRIL
jgi:arabinose-5-phosphate isomerase